MGYGNIQHDLDTSTILTTNDPGAYATTEATTVVHVSAPYGGHCRSTGWLFRLQRALSVRFLHLSSGKKLTEQIEITNSG